MYMITTMQSTIPYTNLSTHPQGLPMKKKKKNSITIIANNTYKSCVQLNAFYLCIINQS